MAELKSGVKNNFTQVRNEIINDEKYFDKYEKWVWIYLLSLTHSNSKPAFPSQRTMAAKVGISERKIRDCLKGLEEKGWLEKSGIHEGYGTVMWVVKIPIEIEIEWDEKKLADMKAKMPEIEKPGQRPQEGTKSKENEIPYKTIIDYLNTKAGSGFRDSSANTIKAINGRWADGFRLDDFKKVIDTKASEWIGTEWEKYLNPETLFRPANFEKYLNQRPVKAQLKQPTFAAPKQTGEVMTEEQRAALLATIDEF